jgi:S-(hydroxymethyl)glutathione dehydrogenase/alcohol dehydrogenase
VKAAVCHEFGAPLRIEEIDLRRPVAREVSVRLAACAICHSDITFMQGAWGGELPAVYGHEAAGVVEAVGPGVDGLAPGDHVVVTLIRSCGRCSLCLRGEPALCEDWPTLPISLLSPLIAQDGSRVQQGVRTAAFAERVLVHSSQVVAVPDDIELDCAALLACGVVTGVGAVINTARVEVGATTAVIGTGGVGLNVVQGAVLAGAGSIVAIDVVAGKLDAATTFGATATLNGVIAAVEQGMELLRRGGTLVVVGMPPSGATAAFEAERIADQGLRILGSKVGSARPNLDIPHLANLYRQDRLKLDELISGRYRLTEINDAIAAAEGGDALRPVVML